jgi:hypothetical protein
VAAEEVEQPLEDRLGGPRRQLLTHDRPHEHAVGISGTPVRGLLDGERPVLVDQPAHHRIGCAQMIEGGQWINTGVPTGTRPKRSITSLTCMRMQPWEAREPIDQSSEVPWIA